MTHPLLSAIQLFLYFGEVKFLEGLTPPEVNVAIKYLGLTLVQVIYCADTMNYFELTEYTERKHLKLKNKPGIWYFRPSVERAYPKLLRFAIKWQYYELLDFLFEQMPPTESQRHDQNVFGTCKLTYEILRRFLRRQINWDQRIKGLLWAADPKIYSLLLDDERFDAIKYTPFIYYILHHHAYYTYDEFFREKVIVITNALRHPKMLAPYLPLQDLTYKSPPRKKTSGALKTHWIF